jgi:hypothetical protein
MPPLCVLGDFALQEERHTGTSPFRVRSGHAKPAGSIHAPVEVGHSNKLMAGPREKESSVLDGFSQNPESIISPPN